MIASPKRQRARDGVLLAAAGVVLGLCYVRPALPVPSSDFPSYWLAGRLAAEGRLDGRVYDYAWFQVQGDAAPGPETLYSFTPQPPTVALAFLPLGALDVATAARTWLGIQAAAAVALVPALAAAAGISGPAAAAALLASGAMLSRDLAVGQVYLPVLLAVVGAALLLARGRDGAGGGLLGAAAAFKLFPALLLVPLALAGRWRALAGAAAAGLGLLGASVAVLGPDVHAAWLGAVLPGTTGGGFAALFHPGGESFLALALQAFHADPVRNPDPWVHRPRLAALAWGLARLAVVAAALRATARARGGGPGTGPAVMALWLQAALLLSPIVTTYHNLLALFPATVGAARQARRGGIGWAWAAAVAGAWLAVAFVQPHFLVQQHALARGPTLPLAFGRLWMDLLVFASLASSLAGPRGEEAGTSRGWERGGAVAVGLAAALAFVVAPLLGGRAEVPGAGSAVPLPDDGWEIATRLAPAAAPGEEPTFAAMDWKLYTVHRGRGVRAEVAGADLFDPAPLPGGGLVFAAVRRGGPAASEVMVQDRGGARRTVSPAGAWCDGPTAGGSRVLFTCREGPDGPGRVHVGSATGAAGGAVPGLGPVAEAAVSPGGDLLALVPPGREGLEVRTAPWAEASGARVSWSDPRWARVERPRFSPDGCRIAFVAWPRGGPVASSRSRIWIGDACGGGAPAPLPSGPWRDRDPSFAPDGSLLFASDRGGGVHGYRVFAWPLPLPSPGAVTSGR
ncbi:glycosyltransferase 87 family protein [Myxococcota bacterium]|nr:glycosyltransferase 87 family protein [Myxococcota bacterium]